jgi:hypothetical protein
MMANSPSDDENDPYDNILATLPSDESELDLSDDNQEEGNPLHDSIDFGDSDEEIEETIGERQWSNKKLKTLDVDLPKYSGIVDRSFVNCKFPVDFFLKFFDDDILQNIVTQSNLYNLQQHHNKKRLIDPISREELYAFIGLAFLFGYHRLPSQHLYWSHDKDFHIQLVSETMSRDRFLDILSNLHVNDNSQCPKNNSDKMFKIRPLIDSLNKNFANFRDAMQYQSIDESMIKFKGRSSLKQYTPLKPIKRGFKLWVRADCKGYVYQFAVYQGKETKDDNNKV